MTRLLSQAILSLSGIAVLAACGSSQTAPRELATVDTAIVSDQAAIDAKLKQRQIVFDSGYKTYVSTAYFKPCDAGLLADLKDAETKTATIDAKLQPDALKYRGDALDFSRKVSDAHLSLSEINNALGSYCAGDYPKQVKCVADPTLLAVHINEATAGAGLIHPFIQLSTKEDTALFIYAGEKTIRTTQASSPYPIIAELISPAQLKTLNNCLNASMTTEVGQAFATTAFVADSDMENNCADLQQKFKQKGLRSSSKAENEFCGIKE